MLKKFLIIFGLLISCNFSHAHPQDGMSPEQLMFHYVKMFNEENLPALQDIFHSPHVRLISGKLVKFEDKSIPVVDFESLKRQVGSIPRSTQSKYWQKVQTQPWLNWISHALTSMTKSSTVQLVFTYLQKMWATGKF